MNTYFFFYFLLFVTVRLCRFVDARATDSGGRSEEKRRLTGEREPME